MENFIALTFKAGGKGENGRGRGESGREREREGREESEGKGERRQTTPQWEGESDRGERREIDNASVEGKRGDRQDRMKGEERERERWTWCRHLEPVFAPVLSNLGQYLKDVL